MNVLIFATGNLIGIARFPKALEESGFNVAVLCPQDSFISKTRFAKHRFFLKSTKQNIGFLKSTIKALVQAIAGCSAKLIIPGDERAAYVLHYIVREVLKGNDNLIPRDILDVISNSLCDPTCFEATNNKNFTQQIAGELGIKVPMQLTVKDKSEALDFATKIGYPVLLKKGIGEAGMGVKICQNEKELIECLQMPLFAKPSPFKQLIRRLLGRDTVWIPNSEILAVQQFICGTPAIFNVVAIAGRTLGGFAGIKQGITATGQSTRVRFINQPDMAAAASSLMSRFKYNGFADLEFMIDIDSGVPYFLECNPRPSTMTHLGKTLGVDLCEALIRGLTSAKYEPLPPLETERVITLFPQEWLHDPQSPHLRSVDHDVPWDDPELMRAYVQLSQKA